MTQPFVTRIILAISLLFPAKNTRTSVIKEIRLRQVYGRLLRTIGSPADAPVLRLLTRSETGAGSDVVYRPGNPAQIEMSEAVLDLCLTFGAEADAAMACLLGHELAHFQYRHGGKQGFFSPVVMPTGSPNSSANLEALADRSGTFMTYLAGYDAFTIAPIIYRKLYDTFGLSNQRPGYPTRAQRLRMVADTTARVQELAQLFDVGEVSYLLRDYEGASRSFAALMARYPTAITLNNLGATKLNLALTRMASARNDTRLGFLLPVEFDADNRLLASPRRGEPLPYQQLVTEALQLFHTALTDQSTHQQAALNAAIAQYLLGKSEQARQTLLSHPPLTANAQLMMAILEADQGEPAKARQLFRQAIARRAYRATENSRLFEESQKPGWVRYWTTLLAHRQVAQTNTKPFRHWPGPASKTPPVSPLALAAGVRYARTDSITVYELPLEENGKAQRYQVQRSRRIALPGLPFGSSPTQLLGNTFPFSVIAGARETTFYEYRRETQRLFLAYQSNRLISWTFAKPTE